MLIMKKLKIIITDVYLVFCTVGSESAGNGLNFQLSSGSLFLYIYPSVHLFFLVKLHL